MGKPCKWEPFTERGGRGEGYGVVHSVDRGAFKASRRRREAGRRRRKWTINLEDGEKGRELRATPLLRGAICTRTLQRAKKLSAQEAKSAKKVLSGRKTSYIGLEFD